VKKQEVRARVEEIGIAPAVRVPGIDDARFAAETVNRGGIPVAKAPPQLGTAVFRSPRFRNWYVLRHPTLASSPSLPQPSRRP
jgi:hypothetical protein